MSTILKVNEGVKVLENLMNELNKKGFKFKMYEWRGDYHISDGVIPAITYNWGGEKGFLVTNVRNYYVMNFAKSKVKELISFVEAEHFSLTLDNESK